MQYQNISFERGSPLHYLWTGRGLKTKGRGNWFCNFLKRSSKTIFRYAAPLTPERNIGCRLYEGQKYPLTHFAPLSPNHDANSAQRCCEGLACGGCQSGQLAAPYSTHGHAAQTVPDPHLPPWQRRISDTITRWLEPHSTEGQSGREARTL